VRIRECREVVDAAAGTRCGSVGYAVTLETPAGRPPAKGGPYCDNHGGRARADSEARADWNYLAPASVGGVDAVMAAGTDCLRSTEAYVVVRPETKATTGVTRWLAWLGLGSHLTPVRSRAGKRAHKRDVPEGAPRGPHAFGSLDDARSAATTVWRSEVGAAVARIQASRGGTLTWGVPVEPLADPIVIELGEHGSAWDVAAELQRHGRAGLAIISGLRPSGEAA